MKTATRTFIRQRFTDYYKKEPLNAPASIEQREFGFIFFDERYPDEIRMKRHIGFGSAQEMTDYIRSLVPAHAYYSTAYYQIPQAPTMQDKKWSGADLIFDLDADHIMHGSYDAMLERIKQETLKLLDVLENELGFNKKTFKLVFSGGRGYHIHINDISYRTWNSAERRELVDYVCGTGIQPAAMFENYRKEIPGWPRRYVSELSSYLTRISEMQKKDAIKEIESVKGIGKTRAERFVGTVDENREVLKVNPLSLNVFDQTIKAVLDAIISDREYVFSSMIREKSVQTDEPVTTDIKRLIRLPGSLHAKSGLRVTPIRIKDLEAFEPLIDAVAFGERDVRIDAYGDFEIPLLGNRYKIKKGVSTVPEAVAVYICCRGMADIAGN